MTDYIKREDALNASKIVYIEYISVDDEGYEDGNADDIPCVFKEDIKKIPAADVRENVHGGWIDSDVNDSDMESTVSLLCENCGNYTEFALIGTPKEVMDTMRFCPRCGSMNGGDEE